MHAKFSWALLRVFRYELVHTLIWLLPKNTVQTVRCQATIPCPAQGTYFWCYSYSLFQVYVDPFWFIIYGETSRDWTTLRRENTFIVSDGLTVLLNQRHLAMTMISSKSHHVSPANPTMLSGVSSIFPIANIPTTAVHITKTLSRSCLDHYHINNAQWGTSYLHSSQRTA